MQIYRFDAESREFLYAEEAALDPLESVVQGREVWLLPADSTFTPPPAGKAGHVAVWGGKAWALMEDHRQKCEGGLPVAGSGTPFWMPGDAWNTRPRYADKPGPLPEGALREAPAKPAEVLEAERLARAKAERAEAVDALTVEVDGLTFDANEKAQERMARAVLMAESPEEQTEWVLHDDSVALVTAEQLRRACRAAGRAQGSLWVRPYK